MVEQLLYHVDKRNILDNIVYNRYYIYNFLSTVYPYIYYNIILTVLIRFNK